VSLPFPQDMQTDDWRMSNCAKLKTRIPGLVFLLKEAPTRFNMDAALLLQSVLLKTLQQWTGRNDFLLINESHGRHLQQADVSGTVGWFTAMYPVHWQWESEDWATSLASLKRQSDKIPAKGLGYGVWKYSVAHDNYNDKIPAIRFNHLGEFGEETDNELFTLCHESSGLYTHESNNMTAQMDIISMVNGGVLQIEIHYNKRAQHASTMQWLLDTWVQNLQQLSRFLKQNPVLKTTSPLFSHSDLSTQEIDEIFQ
jgi:non-ribosomal peptide synthase protein (TIGR01720 family)